MYGGAEHLFPSGIPYWPEADDILGHTVIQRLNCISVQIDTLLWYRTSRPSKIVP